MLRLKNADQMSLWDLALPVDILQLPEELAKVDGWLDDAAFFKPYLEKFNQRIGRPTVPVDTFHRLMYLRFRHRLSYEALVQEVRDSYTWRRFCRIAPNQRIPDSTTLVKLVKKYGPEVLDQLNETLVRKAKERKVLRGKKLRVDSTVVEADIEHPTDADLMADGVAVITRTVKKLRQAGVEIDKHFRDQTNAVRKRILGIAKVLQRRSHEAQAEVRQITGEILKTARRVVTGAKQIAHQVETALKGTAQAARKQVKRLVERLKRITDLTGTVVKQTQAVQSGNPHIPNRVVSLCDPDARPIRKGKLRNPTEFGYKVVIQETEDRLVTGYEICQGNPTDDTVLVPAVERHQKLFGKAPKKVTADRGMSAASNERALEDMGVKQIALPKRGKLTPARITHQKQRWFRSLQSWRAGIEGTISLLKRKYGMRRTRLRGHRGARCWVAGVVWAHNLTRLATME